MRRPWQRRPTRDEDLDDEIRSHFAMAVADRVARGESPDEALAAARREFGNVAHVKEVTRESWGGACLDRLRQDVRYSVRSLPRAPVFAVTAILTLALGIGVTTAMFTVVRGVLLRPLPFASPSELFVVSQLPDGMENIFGLAMADGEYQDFVRATRAFVSTAAYRTYPATLLGAGDPARVPVAAVTPSFFSTLGLRPSLGRVFVNGDDVAGAAGVAIIAASLWRDRFGGDSTIVGRSVTIEGYPKTIVGVMPDGFNFPKRAAVWLPLSTELDPHNARLQVVIGRLKHDMTLELAQAEVRAFAGREERETPPDQRIPGTAKVVGLRDAVVGSARKPILVFALAVGLLVLIACANVSNLTLMRATSRRHELGIRTALGAGRARLVRQLLTESIVIAMIGGILGLGLAVAGVRLLLLTLPDGLLPRAAEVHIDPLVIAVAAIACLAAGLASGTLPAILASRRDPREALSDNSRTTGRAPLRRLFVMAEMGLSLILLIAAGLTIRSFERLQAVDLGFAPGNLLTATLDFPETRYRTAEAIHDVESRVAARIAALPGVRAATAVNWLPLDSTYITGDFTLRDGRPLPSQYMVLKPCVTAGYFATMGIRVLTGRAFLPSDDAASEQVVVISASMARTLWPNGNAVGQQLSFADKPGPRDWMRIIGIVDDVVRNDPASGPIPALYRPIPQVRQIFFINHLTFVARTDGGRDPTAIVGAIRSAIHAVDPEQPVKSIMTMDSRIRATIAEPRFRSLVLVVFSMMALGMAAVGVYGVLAYAVTERSREIGIRMALGASRAAVMRATLRSAIAATFPGVVVGLAGAFAANRLLGQFLFEVRPNDPVSYGTATGVLLLTAICAAVGPARRAARIDPAIAMK